ncbi:site-specific integrase (plasmid) [Bradyrhizobium sp. CCGUVB1N3]|uniref:site-specific integrase n=1 Tax=Bradyrhizobium sp. CCGUVB1N3 TaxID=2949629 RepID=UPI0020B3B06D|nr:site-specific integrase [Bradyrhizobium sp. CCGUVB1N3]MCP3477716.1 site-specific integrase [Bradyrhizobium sp. CCGUVB1N3]
MVALRQTLKTAMRHGWLASLPDMSQPYRSNGKISHRAWFSPTEYKQLYLAAAKRADDPKKERYRYHGQELYDFIIFMANTGLRPDEAKRLEYRDVTVVKDRETDERILEIEVRGKRGVGYCKSMPSAVMPFFRLRKRNKAQPTDRIFPNDQHVLFNNILEEENLKFDREGQRRTAYTLATRPTRVMKTLACGRGEIGRRNGLKPKLECSRGNPRCRTAQIRGSLCW